MNKSFLTECLKQLKDMNFCYVYTDEQLKEVLKHCDKNATYVKNDCGYTIKIVRKGGKNE